MFPWVKAALEGNEASIITVLVSTNTDGFKKMLLLVIEKAEKPHYRMDDLCVAEQVYGVPGQENCCPVSKCITSEECMS